MSFLFFNLWKLSSACFAIFSFFFFFSNFYYTFTSKFTITHNSQDKFHFYKFQQKKLHFTKKITNQVDMKIFVKKI